MGGCQGKEDSEEPRDKHNECCSYDGPGPWYVSALDAEVRPRMAKTGTAGPQTVLTTVPALLAKAAAEKADMQALLVERPSPALVDNKAPPPLPREEWTAWTFAQYHEDVRRLARAFVHLGMHRFESVNIWGFNAPEWYISALAATFAGGKCAGLYPTDTPETAAYKVVHSCGSIVVVEDAAKAQKLVKALSARGDAKRIKAFVTYGHQPAPGETLHVAGCGSVPFLSWEAVIELGKSKEKDAEVDSRVAATKPGHCAAIIYTSGTTGEPKGVMISHDNLHYEVQSVLDVLKESCRFGIDSTEERILSYLPLSHVAGLMLDIGFQLVLSAHSKSRVAAFFARPYDLKVGSLKDRLSIAKPTVFLGVPLVWEKVADKMRQVGAEGSNLQKQVAGWAKGLALTHAKNSQFGGSGNVPWGYSASALVLNKVKARLGLDECKFPATGAAPIRVDTLEYFASLDLGINEIYGMTECSAAATVSSAKACQWGSCGMPLPGGEVKAFIVDPTDMNIKAEVPKAPSLDCTEDEYQGEICIRGRHVMMGYMACPDFGAHHAAEIQKKNAEAIDKDGWLHSGDKGMVTNAGMVKITGRYKEIIIGDGGENIAPVPIEDQVKKACDGIMEVMMVGDKRKYNVALVTLKAVGANGEVPGTDDLDAGARRINPEVTKISKALDDKVWIKAVTAAITAANENGRVCPNNAFKIQKFTILPTNFSEEKGELTPTKKLKRKAVEAAYLQMIEKMYESKETYVRYQA